MKVRARFRVPGSLIAVTDQAVSSLSNLLVTFAVARAANLETFGAFSLAFTLYLVTITVAKGTVGSVFSLRMADSRPDAIVERIPQGITACLSVGAVAGLAIALPAWIFAGASMYPVVLLACALPILVAQDAARQIAYVLRRPYVALANSAAWAVSQVAVFAGLHLAGQATPETLLAAWCATSIVGLGLALLLFGTWPAWSSPAAWFREFGSFIRSISGEFALIAGVAQGAPLLVAIAGSLADIGSFRGAITLFGPVTMVMHGLMMNATPASRRLWSKNSDGYGRPVAAVGFGVAALAVLWGTALTLLPQRGGEALLGPTWDSAYPLLPLIGLWLAAGYLAEPAVVILRVSDRHRTTYRIRLIAAPLTLASALVGTMIAGALGASVGLAIASVLMIAMFWVPARRIDSQNSMLILRKADRRLPKSR